MKNLLFVFSLLLTKALIAQPANDDCASAIPVLTNAFGTTCIVTSAATTVNATPGTTAPACASLSVADDDIWYSFTPTSNSVMIRVSNAVQVPSGAATIAVEILSGTCTTLNTVFCSNSFAFGSGLQIVNGLTIGTPYYLRFWTFSTTNDANFNFCIQDVPASPVNDNCTGALGLTINPFGTACTTPISVNTTGATPSAPNPSCTGTENNDDVWYTFTATSASILVRVNNATLTTASGTSNVALALYEGTCPVSTTGLACEISFAFGSGFKIIDGLTVGSIYFLRVWIQGINNYGTFNLCVQEVPPPPPNNDCTGAIGLTVNPFGTTCNSAIAVNTTGATPSLPAPSCTTTENNDDVWYSFTASSASVIIRINNATLTTATTTPSVAFALYSTSCPATTSTFTCEASFAFGSGHKIVDGLIIGNTYLLRVWIQANNNYGTFNLCVQEVPPSAANNECSNAIGLIVNPFGSNCTGTVVVNTTGATPSTPFPSCTSIESNDDLWYSFTATSQSVLIRVSNGVLTTSTQTPSMAFALYESGCPATTATFACDISFAFGSGYKIVDGLTIGNTYLLRVWIQGANNYGIFNLCVQEVPPPPINDNCINAITITPGPPTAICLLPTLVNTSGATSSSPAPSCTSTAQNDDVWYSFTATAITHKILVTEAVLTTSASPAFIGYALYSSCPTTTAGLSCNSAFALGNGSATFTGLTVGTVYYLRLWTDNPNNYGSFKFCIVEAPANNECTGAVNVPVSNGFCTAPIVGSLTNATTSAGFGVPACNTSAISVDVWYKTTVPATGNLLIQTSAVNTTIQDLLLEAYTGACGALTLISCDDNSNPETSPSANHARICLTGRTPGEIIYYRVMPLNFVNQGDFVICAWDTSSNVLPDIASGVNCIAAPAKDISTASLNRYMWVPLLDSSGKIIAEIYADGNSLNTIQQTINIHNGSVRNFNGNYYLDRNWSVYPGSIGTSKIRIYFKNIELAALQNVDSTVNLNNLQVLQVLDSCISGPALPNNIIQTTTGNYGTHYYIQFTTGNFNSYYLVGKCGPVITWNGNNSTSWNDPQNWDCGGVPWKFSSVLIPGGRVRYPVVTQTTEIKSITIFPGANVEVISGVNLKVNSQ